MADGVQSFLFTSGSSHWSDANDQTYLALSRVKPQTVGCENRLPPCLIQPRKWLNISLDDHERISSLEKQSQSYIN
jgi:hypothetical protein